MGQDDQEQPGAVVTSLVAAPPPSGASGELEPAELEAYVRAAMHQDRRPGNVLAVVHPLRMYKVPRGLFAALREVGFHVEIVETHPDRVTSARRIRDGLLALSGGDLPLDLLVVSGDGSLDHHVLVATFWAFYPDLVRQRPGEIEVSATPEEIGALPRSYRQAFLPADPSALVPDDDTIRSIWLLRGRLEGLLRRGRSPARICRAADRDASDPLLRIAVLAALLPHRVKLRAHGFDLTGLAKATRERTFQGLYQHVRSICAYPAGTAADNALYAGVPGYAFAQVAGLLGRFEGIRRRLEARATARFLDYFLHKGVVVPARFSLVAFDGDWQALSSHAAGGPGSGRFFSADLTSKTRGLLGYLMRMPRVVVQEGIFGSTIVRISARDAAGRVKSVTEGQIAEGLYTNRAFIAGVGSVPSTNPTSFAGQSSLVLAPPIWGHDPQGNAVLDLHGLLTLAEGMVKGVLGRLLHLVGLNVRNLAGGGKFGWAVPEHQVTLKEGEELEIAYLTRDRKPRFVPTQVSGDPFQAHHMTIRVAWGPIPLLAAHDSLLLESARRSLVHLRVEQSYRLRAVHIGGLRYFRHLVGEEWTQELTERTGLFPSPPHLPRSMAAVQRLLLQRWQRLQTGDFVDTSESGLQLGRRGRSAHNNDQTAHLVILREPRSVLLVRQVRARPPTGDVYESRTTYRAVGGAWVVHVSETRLYRAGEHPRVLQEEHYFRSAEAFRHEAPAFVPFIKRSPDETTLAEVTEEIGTENTNNY